MAEKSERRVLFLTHHLPLPSEAGAFRPWMTARLLKHIGCDVTVITCGVHYMTGKDTRPAGGWCSEEHVDGIRILKTWAPRDHRRSIFRRLLNYAAFALLGGIAAFVKVRGIDRVITGTHPQSMMPVAYLVSLLKRAPLVLDERDLYPETAIALGVIRDGWFAATLFRVQQIFRRRAVGIIAATPGIRRRLIATGCPESKVNLLRNADVYFDHDDPGDLDVEDLRETTGKAFLVGYTGGLGFVNDIPTLLRAAGRLGDTSDIGIVVVGSGERLERYRDYCVEHGIDNAFFREAVGRVRSRHLMREMDVCVQPLPANEHFAATLTSKTFDYHAAGRPMIFCGTGDTAELLADSGGGITVPPGDDEALAAAIRRLHEDEPLKREMGAAAREWFERNVSVDSAAAIMENALYGAATRSDTIGQ